MSRSPEEAREAVEALYRAYTPYLRAIVRRNLSDQLKGKFDSMDVVQSVWVQVARQLGQEGWHIDNEDQLRALLATIAIRRMANRARRPNRQTDLPEEEWDDVPDERPARPSEI